MDIVNKNFSNSRSKFTIKYADTQLVDEDQMHPELLP
jgi:hypothetical protein